ncbi:MFS transporter [Candidatus Schneideria nysicola]|uniref:MFS transporter n=1 Tax=Candidatus Schneideria nysicola TaxID=1081631 RepID=UPI001CAA7C01|nr:MFS transporter [Candidatus Schneideria nysicola]UAJ65195.1 MFS transporter [Candidatus Schneideria nysicola]UAJ65730.1 MFS transporter [Candidatus Schneideria nysicola]
MSSLYFCLHPHHRIWIFWACMLATFMAAVEVTIVATAMPNIIADLGGFHYFGWIFSIYLLIQSITIPIYGRLADLLGRKLIFFIGTTLFLIGSMMCGFAKSILWLIIFRAIQAFGAGSIVPLASTILADIYKQEERANIQGYLSSVWAISAIMGPLIGGMIVKYYHWSGIFWINIPLGLISIILLMRFLPSMPNKNHNYTYSDLDIAGISYLTLAISSLLLLLLPGTNLGNWNICLLILTLISSILLIREQRISTYPLFPLALWKNKVIIASNIGSLIIGASMMGIAAFLPTYIQAIISGSPFQAGWTLAVMSIGWTLASTLSGRLMLQTSYRFVALLGASLLFFGSVMLLHINIYCSITYAQLSAFVIGIGTGMCNTTFLVSVQNESTYSIRGIATASTLFTRMLGSAFGTAILSAVLNLNLKWRLPLVRDPLQILIATDHNFFSNDYLEVITSQVKLSMYWMYFFAVLIALFAFFSAVLIPRGLRPSKNYSNK